jgi:hypothetical protein
MISADFFKKIFSKASFSKQPSMDAFYQCYKQKKSFTNALQSFRDHYPNSTVYIINDGGDATHAEQARQFNCIYVYREDQTGHENTTWFQTISELRTWIYGLRDAIKTFKNKWFILLEDDVRVMQPVALDKLEYDVNGCNFDVKLDDSLCEYVAKYHDRPSYYGGFGGTIYRTEFFRKILNDSNLEQHLEEFAKRRSYPLASDTVVTFLTYLYGGHIGPYEGYFETWYKNYTGEKIVIHKFKDDYVKDE